MGASDSAIDQDELARARSLLEAPGYRESVWPVVGAATFCAVAALAFATAMIMAPPVIERHVLEPGAAQP